MGKRSAALLALVLATGFAKLPRTASLEWLGGRWVQEGPEGWAEESWTEPRGGVMLGTGRTGKGDKALGFEFMRIADGPEGAVFWGSPGGKTAVAFPLVQEGPNFAAFENPKHDYPSRISYRREGKLLIATTSGPGGTDPQTWRYRRR
ncbi:MAG TPA: DUF6265 family protein [Allosphingosinicella sp.]|jgi:hypothetical protein